MLAAYWRERDVDALSSPEYPFFLRYFCDTAKMGASSVAGASEKISDWDKRATMADPRLDRQMHVYSHAFGLMSTLAALGRLSVNNIGVIHLRTPENL